MAAKFKVGDTVKLNDEGLKTIWGSTVGLSKMKTIPFIVSQIDSESITFPEETYVMEVSDPDLNQYLLSDYMFDLVTRAPNKSKQTVAMDIY